MKSLQDALIVLVLAFFLWAAAACSGQPEYRTTTKTEVNTTVKTIKEALAIADQCLSRDDCTYLSVSIGIPWMRTLGDGWRVDCTCYLK